MTRSSIRAEKQEEIGKLAHRTAVISRWAPEIGPVLRERKAIASMDLQGIQKLVGLEAVR